MDVSDILSPEAVRSVGHLTSKKRVLQELAELAGAAHGFAASDSFDALQERETLGPTGVGHGVALPHARIEGLGHVVGTFLKLDKPVDFDAPDRQPVDLIFALFAPQGAGVDHLKALAMVSRMMGDRAVRSKLRANDDPATLYAVLAEARSSKAA